MILITVVDEMEGTIIVQHRCQLSTGATVLDFSGIVAEALRPIKKPCIIFITINNRAVIELHALNKVNGILYVVKQFRRKELKFPIPETTVSEKYLTYVNDKYNNNKYYRLFDNGNGTCTAEYGRIGLNETELFGKRQTVYPLFMFYIKLMEKEEKGYQYHQLQSDEQIISVGDYKPISNVAIRNLIDSLREVCAQDVSKKYIISPVNVSESMLCASKKEIELLESENDLLKFNDILLRIFTILPRRMEKVSLYLANTNSDYNRIIIREKKLLDNMILQVKLNNNSSDQTVLDALKLTVEEGSELDYQLVNRHLSFNLQAQVKKVYVINNHLTKSNFDEFVNKNQIQTIQLLWHGSTNENWLSILTTGLSLNPDAIINGKLFGNGIYFALSSKKSFGYTSAKGSFWASGESSIYYMALYETAYGNPLKVKQFEQSFSKLNKNSFKTIYPNYHCLHALAGFGMLKNDEVVFYNEHQINCKYLVEFKLVS